MFVRALPFPTAARVWDCALLEDCERFMAATAIATLTLCEKALLVLDFEQVSSTT